MKRWALVLLLAGCADGDDEGKGEPLTVDDLNAQASLQELSEAELCALERGGYYRGVEALTDPEFCYVNGQAMAFFSQDDADYSETCTEHYDSCIEAIAAYRTKSWTCFDTYTVSPGCNATVGEYLDCAERFFYDTYLWQASYTCEEPWDVTDPGAPSFGGGQCNRVMACLDIVY